MSVLNQPFPKQSGCFGFNLNQESSSLGSHDGFVKQHQVDQAVMTRDDKQKKQEIDALLSEAMNNLTFQEREKQQEVLHGVDDEIKEEGNIVDIALSELDNHLIRIKRGSVYEIAERMDPAYVHARAFRVMFLRGNRYDTKAAANQMLKFFETKQDLFGTEKLTKDITIDDLDEDDIACLKTGWLQLAGKDRSGRVVHLQLLHLRAYKTLKNEYRMKYYMLMDLLQTDEDVQLKGVCGLTYAAEDCTDAMNGAGYFEHIELTNAIPVHIASVHYCCSKMSEYLFLNLAIKAMPPKLRARFRSHFGSHVECQYRLSTYGILGENLPLMPDSNKVDMKYHLQWCQARLTKPMRSDELKPKYGPHLAAAKKPLKVIQPTANDVLYMGGDRSNNTGNVHLRNLVAEWSETYDDSETNEAKRRIVYEVIEEVHRSGGRFLNQEVVDGASVWVRVPRDALRLKITQAFRNHRRKVRGTRKKKN
mmetsp:Transcript_33280/g.80478  ORF Transcript_33280/g.80478 Transcript_33280/m.80478 type:complete len:477 (+) Transcript_33280:132-1562(+)